MAILNQEIPENLKQKIREETAKRSKNGKVYEKDVVVDILTDYFKCK